MNNLKLAKTLIDNVGVNAALCLLGQAMRDRANEPDTPLAYHMRMLDIADAVFACAEQTTKITRRWQDAEEQS